MVKIKEICAAGCCKNTNLLETMFSDKMWNEAPGFMNLVFLAMKEKEKEE